MKRNVLIGLAALVLVATAFVLWRFHAMDNCLENGGIWDVNNARCVCTPDELVLLPSKNFATYCKAVPAP